MKIAICFAGLPRFVKEGYKLFSKNLIGLHDMDIFFHSWNNGATGNHENLSRLDSINEVKNLYNVIDFIHEDQKYDIAPENISHKEFVHWSMFYSIWSANNIKCKYEIKTGIKYDCVIRTRFDCALLSTLDVTKYNNFNSVYAPWIHKHGVIMDWLNFSSSDIMDVHANLWKHMQYYKNKGVPMTSGEELLTSHLRENNINFKSAETNAKLIRATGKCPDTWIRVDDL